MTSQPEEDEDMSETEPEVQTEEVEDERGVPGQIQYPPIEVDAERAGAFVAGDVETLYPEDEAPAEEEPTE